MSIGQSAFAGCSSLTSIEIPSTVTNVGNGAFSGCPALDTLYFNAISCPYFAFNAYDYPFYKTNLSKIIIGDNVKIIPAHFAYYQDKLTSILIPNSVITIGEGAFENCSGLQEITIPNSVTNIGDDAFHGCSGLKSITFGESVNSIGKYALWVFSSTLSNITCLATTPPNADSKTFAMYTATLHVPAGSIEAYETTSPWSNFTNIVGINEPGDVNGDGGINISDVTSLIDLLLSGGEISAGADVNGDGQVNISDVTALIDRLLSGN